MAKRAGSVGRASGKKAAPAKAATGKARAKAPAKKPVAAGGSGQRKAAPSATAPAGAGDGWLAVGRMAPGFSLPTHDGKPLSLESLRGKPVVIYFYPKDDTPGCTVEACGFRDHLPRFGKHGATVLGISPDGPASHARFRAKHRLPFTLLADEHHAVAERFGAWREKSLYGRKYMGVARSTFILDAAGRVAKVFTTVKPDGHAEEVLAALADLG